METRAVSTLAILAAYMVVVLLIGTYAYRRTRSTLEDYHMASREFRTFILWCAVFGTNISAVTLIGLPGQAYQVGWIAWPYFVSSWGWLSPLLFYTVSRRAWALGKKLGYMTQADVIAGRWNSRALGYFVSGICLFYTVPYLMTGAIGGGQALSGLTGGAVPYWVGALVVVVVVCLYVAAGGMRGTAWTNVLQTLVFLVGGTAIFLLVAYAFGGPARATQQVAAQYPELLSRANFPWQTFFSYGIIVSFAVPMFPQVFIRLLAGREPRSLKQMSLIYPGPALLIFFVMAYVGMWGHLAVPDLKGPEADKILPLLLARYAPVWATGILGAAIFAALMSTMDAQLLTTGTMLIKDFLLKAGEKSVVAGREVAASRILVVVLAGVAYILALLKPAAIITIINWSFGGFAALLLPCLAAMYWERCTKGAVWASLIVSQFVLIGLPLGWLPARLAFGMLPGVPAIVAGLIALVVVTYLTPARPDASSEAYFQAAKSTASAG